MEAFNPIASRQASRTSCTWAYAGACISAVFDGSLDVRPRLAFLLSYAI